MMKNTKNKCWNSLGFSPTDMADCVTTSNNCFFVRYFLIGLQKGLVIWRSNYHVENIALIVLIVFFQNHGNNFRNKRV